MDTKICSKCKKELPLSEFGFKSKIKNTLLARCKECIKQDKRECYYKHLENNIARIRERKDNYKKSLKELKDKAKEQGCIICGEKDIACLDFHHIKSKDFTIAANRYCSIETMKNEISKCIVVCSNCHRKIHYYTNNIYA